MKNVDPADVRTDWEEYADSHAEAYERAARRLDCSPSGCRYLVRRLHEEPAMADRVLKHLTLRPAVAPMYQWVVYSAALPFAQKRVELMLTLAPQKLGLTWREDTRQHVEDGSIRVHVGPAVFRLSDIFVLQLAEERSRLGRNGNPAFKSIERVVLVEVQAAVAWLWNAVVRNPLTWEVSHASGEARCIGGDAAGAEEQSSSASRNWLGWLD